jgi:branched-chain amino acid transport system ATP-binding protein
MLTINNVTVDFGGVKAVNDVSFSFQDQELLGLIGPNGAGKTTLMRVITGTVKPTSGTVELGNSSLNGKAPYLRIRAGIGISQQIVHPFKSMTVLENVTFAAGHSKTDQLFLSLFKTNRTVEKEEALNLLKMVGIEDAADAKPENLPLGFIKRLELARALALKPKLLLLDEPLAGLNQSEAERLSDTLLRLNQQGQNIILIEHNLTEVVRICQRLVVIDNGKKIGEGEPKTVMNDPVVRTAYLGRS